MLGLNWVVVGVVSKRYITKMKRDSKYLAYRNDSLSKKLAYRSEPVKRKKQSLRARNLPRALPIRARNLPRALHVRFDGKKLA